MIGFAEHEKLDSFPWRAPWYLNTPPRIFVYEFPAEFYRNIILKFKALLEKKYLHTVVTWVDETDDKRATHGQRVRKIKKYTQMKIL